MKTLPDLPITDEEIPMLARGWRQEFMDFTTGYNVPNRFEHYLQVNGYKPAEGNGLLLSACGNVHFHTDDARMSAVWVLAAKYTVEEPTLPQTGNLFLLKMIDQSGPSGRFFFWSYKCH